MLPTCVCSLAERNSAENGNLSNGSDSEHIRCNKNFSHHSPWFGLDSYSNGDFGDNAVIRAKHCATEEMKRTEEMHMLAYATFIVFVVGASRQYLSVVSAITIYLLTLS